MNNSIEITTKTNISKLNGSYKDIFITWLPSDNFNSLLNKVKELKLNGYNPIPHIPVRKIYDNQQIYHISKQLSNYTNTILLIRGGGKQEGKFNIVQDVIDTGILNNKFNIGVAGFPEGNGNLSYEQSLSILKEKTKYAKFVVSQWSLNKGMIKRFINDSPLPVYLGLPNKCSLKQLLKFARICGIENSIKYTINNSKNLIKLIVNGFDPSNIIKEVKYHKNLKGFHLYSFG